VFGKEFSTRLSTIQENGARIREKCHVLQCNNQDLPKTTLFHLVLYIFMRFFAVFALKFFKVTFFQGLTQVLSAQGFFKKKLAILWNVEQDIDQKLAFFSRFAK
jgi:hypothetical protein